MSKTLDVINGRGREEPTGGGPAGGSADNPTGPSRGNLLASAAFEARTWHELHDERCLELMRERQARRVAEGELAVKEITLRRESLRRRAAEGDVIAAAEQSVRLGHDIRAAADGLIVVAEHLVDNPATIPSPAAGFPQYPRPVDLLNWVVRRGDEPVTTANNLLDALTVLGIAGRFKEAQEYRRLTRELEVHDLVRDGRLAAQQMLASAG